MQIFEVAPLRQKTLALLLARRGEPMTTGALAVALAVPFWVADVVLDELQVAGEAAFAGTGWHLTCSATMALALSMPATCRAPTTPEAAP